MSLEDIIQEEFRFAGYEYQIKFKTEIAESDLIHLGARKLGTVFHEDRFFIAKSETIKSSDELVRVRKEGEEDLLFTYKGPVARQKLRNRLVVNKNITNLELKEIESSHREIISLNKKRSIFVLGRVRILLDKVDYLGSFVEFDVEKETDYGLIDPILEKLNLNPGNAIKLSYFEMALISSQPFKRAIFKLYYKLESFAFGISSAVMTVMGIIVGLVSAQQSISAVIGGIASVGIADSMADALGVYTAKKSEKGSSDKVALRVALATFWSKLFFSASFVAIFMIFPNNQTLTVSIIWGLAVLAGIHFLIAFAREEKIIWNILKNIGLAIIIILTSFWVGSLIQKY